MHFVADSLANGRRIRCLTLVDDLTKEYLATVVDTSITSLRVARELERIIEAWRIEYNIERPHSRSEMPRPLNSRGAGLRGTSNQPADSELIPY